MKVSHRIRKITLTILSILIIASFTNSAFAEDTDSFPKVSLHSSSYILLDEILMLPSIDGNIVSMTVELYNGEARDLTFIDYWINLKTKAGSVFSVSLIEENESSQRISSNTKQQFTFYAKVPDQIQLHDLIVEFIHWDFTMPNYERVLGSVAIPESYNPVTPSGKSKSLYVESTKLETEIKQFRLQSHQGRTQATVQFLVQNAGARSVMLPDYKYYIRTEEGLLYGLNHARGGTELTIQPQDIETIYLQGILPSSVNSETWELVVTANFNTVHGVETAVAFYNLIEEGADDSVVAAGESAVLDIRDTPVRTLIEEVVKYERDDRWRIELVFSFENEGSDTIQIPEYQYTIKTREGIRYPLTSSSDVLNIQPRVKEELQLVGTIPTSVDENGWELIVEEKDETNEVSFPLAIYEIPQMKQRDTQGIPVGQVYEFANPDGEYGLELVTLQRLPWNQEDILSAEIHIHNRDNKSVPVPDISGYFELDGVSLSEDIVSVIKLDQILALGPNEKTRLIMYSKIPYTYEFNELSLILEEKRRHDEDSFELALVDFTARSSQLALTTVEAGEAFKIKTIGNRASVSVRSAETYSDSHSRLYYMQIEVENEEKRQNRLPSIAGFLKTMDGSYFPVTLQEADQYVITPSGKALLAAHALLPYGVSTSNVKLVLGELIDGESDAALVTAAEMIPPSEVRRPRESMEQIEIYPYQVSFSRFRLHLSPNGGTLTFHYELKKNRQYQILPEGHKLVMELVDDETPYEQTFEFETDLKLGNHIGQMTANFNIGDVAERMSEGTDFWVRVYDEYEGYRKLLASQRVLLIERN